MISTFRTALKHVRVVNTKTVLNIINESKPHFPKITGETSGVSDFKTFLFSPRSLNVEVHEKPVVSKIKQDPLSYVPIINPRSILPLIEDWRKDEIGFPTPKQEEKHAVRLIVIRRKKMKKHQRRKLKKRMKYRWAKIKKRRRLKKEKTFQNELLAMVKEANEFSAEKYVAEKLHKVNHTPLPTRWRHKKLPAFIIRQLLGIDKKINYKHNEFYKA